MTTPYLLAVITAALCLTVGTKAERVADWLIEVVFPGEHGLRLVLRRRADACRGYAYLAGTIVLILTAIGTFVMR